MASRTARHPEKKPSMGPPHPPSPRHPVPSRVPRQYALMCMCATAHGCTAAARRRRTPGQSGSPERPSKHWQKGFHPTAVLLRPPTHSARPLAPGDRHDVCIKAPSNRHLAPVARGRRRKDLTSDHATPHNARRASLRLTSLSLLSKSDSLRTAHAQTPPGGTKCSCEQPGGGVSFGRPPAATGPTHSLGPVSQRCTHNPPFHGSYMITLYCRLRAPGGTPSRHNAAYRFSEQLPTRPKPKCAALPRRGGSNDGATSALLNGDTPSVDALPAWGGHRPAGLW